jgi:2-polyprenyl-3-methyl-5-hydroxy-6-metoxy-1,4-benzoquinol methylase
MMQGPFQSCPYCQSASPYGLYYAGKLYFRCRSCDLIFLPRSESEDDACIRHYRDDYFKSSSEDQLNVRRTMLYERVIGRIEKEKQPGSLMDVGCGRGIFLQVARRRGWLVSGIDPSAASISEAEKSLKGRIFCATLDSLAAEHSHDVVTLINVLDHMLDIRKEISYARALLKDGGLLYLRFPNGLFHASLLKLAGRVRVAVIMQRLVIFHQYSLTPRFTRRLLREAGFSKIAIHNSPLVGSDIYRTRPLWPWLSALLNQAIYLCAGTLDLCTWGRFLIGPSLEVTAVKSQSPIQ